MEPARTRALLEDALRRIVCDDRHLLENDLSERCIAARLAMYLQQVFPEHSVDVEYNRDGADPKMLNIPEGCANYHDRRGRAFVVPDVIVHRRGRNGPNLLVLELKKTSNPDGAGCDRMRVRAFRAQLGYSFGALIECETRRGREPEIRFLEWIDA